MDADKRVNRQSEIGSVRTGEKNLEETRSLSPIEEESESTPFFKEVSGSFTVSESEESGCGNVTFPYKEQPRMSRKMEDSSSGDEQMEPNCQLRRVRGSYCCFKPEAEASGDNDEAELGLRDRSLRTTVEQLKRRLSQAEREIVALKRYRSPQKCQSHERCEILRKDMLTWRDDCEKRINSHMASWQLTEQKRLRDEIGDMRGVYDTIQRHLEALERQSARSYLDFRRQIDVWEKRFKEDVVSLHDSDSMKLREQLRAWCEMQNVLNSSRVRQADAADKSRQSETAKLSEDNAKLLHRLEHVIKLEVQQQRDDLLKRMDQKVARLWSAFENFKHNFHLDRDYTCRQVNYDTDNDDADSMKTGSSSDVAPTRGTISRFDLNSSNAERKFAP